MTRDPKLVQTLNAQIDAVASGATSAASAAAHARAYYFGLSEAKDTPDTGGLSDEDRALSVHKGYIHDRAGNKHDLTDKQRRMFMAKLGSEANYRAALSRAHKRK